MPLLTSCLCCSLFIGTGFCGVYAAVAYLSAFGVELWWIVDSNEGLPAPAYILCAGYLIVFLISLTMLAGLATRRSKYVLGWLFVTVLFLFPECGMVLFMSLYHWRIDNTRGLIELVFYICRAAVNVLSIICVQSHYIQWRNEKMVNKRLNDMKTMQNGIVYKNKHVTVDLPVGNGSTKLGDGSNGAGYQNPVYVGSGDFVTVNGKTGKATVKRTSSSLSHVTRSNGYITSTSQRMSTRSLMNPSELPSKECSEFNPSALSSWFIPPVRTYSELGLASYASASNGLYRDGWHVARHKYLDEADYYSRPPPSRPVSSNYVNVHPDYYTQSLDRRLYMRCPRRASSVDALNLRMPGDEFLRQLPHGARPTNYMNRSLGSLSSMGAESEGSQKYRDVAL